MIIDTSIFQEIIRRILSVSAPQRIVLLGSAATGNMTEDSDIDLLVLSANPGNPRQESVRLRRALGGLGFPMDVLVMSTDRFEETKNIIGGIACPANKYGRVIYEAD